MEEKIADSRFYDVFLSHNRYQKSWVRALYKLLVQHGLKVFFDEDDIAPGENIITAIERGIEFSRHVVLVLSPSSLSSPWVAMETQLTLHQDPSAVQNKLIPIILEDVDTNNIRLSVRSLNWIDLRSPKSREDRLRFLLNHLGIPTAYQLPAYSLKNLLRPSSTPDTQELHVVGIDDVMRWQWDGQKLLEQLIQLDYTTTDGLTHAHEGNPEQWGPVFMNHPETWRLLITEPKNIVGYWHVAPLFSAEYELAKSGNLLDSQITVDTVQFFELSDHYDLYFVQICMHPQYISLRNIKLLFESFFEVLDNLSAEGIFVREICANAYTKVGVSLCRSFNMEPVCKHAEHGLIYAAPIAAVLSASLARIFPDLLNRYRQEGLL